MNAGPPSPRILVVDDEQPIRELVRSYLVRDGFEVFAADDGPSALEAMRQLRPDVVVLDLMLPGLDGVEVCRQLRTFSDAYVIMLTARDEEVDRIVGLSIGADDYMVKPFSPKELVARARAVLRRVEGKEAAIETIRVAGVVIDLPRMRVTVEGRPVELTATEFVLLATLAREPGRVFTRAQLLDAAHGVAFEAYERAIDAHVKNIRRKLEPASGPPRYIQTVYGVGYRFAEA